MKTKKYRLIEHNGFESTWWTIEEKILWWWSPLNSILGGEFRLYNYDEAISYYNWLISGGTQKKVVAENEVYC